MTQTRDGQGRAGQEPVKRWDDATRERAAIRLFERSTAHIKDWNQVPVSAQNIYRGDVDAVLSCIPPEPEVQCGAVEQDVCCLLSPGHTGDHKWRDAVYDQTGKHTRPDGLIGKSWKQAGDARIAELERERNAARKASQDAGDVATEALRELSESKAKVAELESANAELTAKLLETRAECDAAAMNAYERATQKEEGHRDIIHVKDNCISGLRAQVADLEAKLSAKELPGEVSPENRKQAQQILSDFKNENDYLTFGHVLDSLTRLLATRVEVKAELPVTLTDSDVALHVAGILKAAAPMKRIAYGLGPDDIARYRKLIDLAQYQKAELPETLTLVEALELNGVYENAGSNASTGRIHITAWTAVCRYILSKYKSREIELPSEAELREAEESIKGLGLNTWGAMRHGIIGFVRRRNSPSHPPVDPRQQKIAALRTVALSDGDHPSDEEANDLLAALEALDDHAAKGDHNGL